MQTKLTKQETPENKFQIPTGAFLQKYVKNGRESIYVESKMGRTYPAQCTNTNQYSKIKPGDWVWVTRTQKQGKYPEYKAQGWFPSTKNRRAVEGGV